MANRDFDAFISHSSADSAIANSIVEALESRGVRCWVAPRDVRAGFDFQAEIVTALESARCLILLFSTRANDSEHVHREVLLADNAKTPVYPVRIEDATPSGALKYQLANRQYIDYFADKKRVLDTLVGRIAQRRSVIPPKDDGTPVEQIIRVPPPPGSAATEDIGSDDGLRRWLPPALDPMYLLFQFKGRIGRRSYLFGQFSLFLLAALAGYVLYSAILPIQASSPEVATVFLAGGFGLLAFVLLYSSMALVSKRLHDFGRSAWWATLNLGALIGTLIAASYAAVNSGSADFADLFQSTSAWERVVAVVAVMMNAVATVFGLWLLFWPGQASQNKYGPAPSFSRRWRPFDKLAQRVSARSEFDVPFVILSSEGRIGPKGLLVGLLFLLWVGGALWFFKVVGFRSLAPFALENTSNVFMGYVGLGGMAATAVFALVVFSCVVGKRLHDIGVSAWLQISVSVGLLIVLAIASVDGGAAVAGVSAVIWFALVFAVLFALPGRKDFNAYGPPPGFRVDALRERPKAA